MLYIHRRITYFLPRLVLDTQLVFETRLIRGNMIYNVNYSEWWDACAKIYMAITPIIAP